MATTDDLLADPELLASAWDLDPIVDGEGSAGVERLLDEALARSAKFAEAYTGRIASLDGAGPARGDARARRDPGAGRPRRQLRDAAVHHRHRRPGARRAAADGAGARHRARDAAAVLRARVGRARRRAGRGAARERSRPRVLRAPPAQRPPLPPAPALRARGEGDGGEEPGLERRPGRGCSASRSRRSA